MQAFFRVISLASFVMSASVIGGGAYVYVNREAIIDNVKAQVIEAATGAITEALPGMLDDALPNVSEGIPTEAPGGDIPTTLPAF